MKHKLRSLDKMFPKRAFDPANPADVAAYKKYLKNNSWGTNCQIGRAHV